MPRLCSIRPSRALRCDVVWAAVVAWHRHHVPETVSQLIKTLQSIYQWSRLWRGEEKAECRVADIVIMTGIPGAINVCKYIEALFGTVAAALYKVTKSPSIFDA